MRGGVTHVLCERDNFEVVRRIAKQSTAILFFLSVTTLISIC